MLRRGVFGYACAFWIILLGGSQVACNHDNKKSSTEAASGEDHPKTESPPAAERASDKSEVAEQEPQPDSKEAKPETVAVGCPSGMKEVPGGVFWVGTEREVYDREENPRFSTKVKAFCADEKEVSTQEFESCVQAGKCDALTMNNKTCNRVSKGRGDHPINCITYEQAEQVCRLRGARLPTEIEWEYMARGGAEMRDYPWGSEQPDGHTCWKHAGSCERGSFERGAFGLYDVVGNVWEWTSSWWGRYPWPSPDGNKRVYRGGSWSRRFEKWMRPSLRNRLDPKKAGSHLGVRCVKDDPRAECPYGKTEDGSCKAGVEEVMCLDRAVWNGVRCALPQDKRRCKPGTHEEDGYGCVRERVSGAVQTKLDTKSVMRKRSPQFDADCQENTPQRPHAYRFEGGGHLARNAVGKSMGCKNRDVGVGFNSSCCP